MSHRRAIPKFYFIFGFILLSACGRNVDPTLEPYLNNFLALAQENNLQLNNMNISMEFDDGPMMKGAKGICYQETQRIFIDRKFWYETSEEQREWLVLHELGHCIGLLGHDETYFKDVDSNIENPTSIMIPAAVYAEGRYNRLKNYYNVELIQKIRKNLNQ